MQDREADDNLHFRFVHVELVAALHRLNNAQLVELPDLERVVHAARHDELAVEAEVLRAGARTGVTSKLMC